MNIGIFCQFNTPFAKVADITVPVMREYADRHGYKLTVDRDRPISRSIVWDRYEILASEVKKYDWAVHMDADVLITNLHIRLEEFMARAGDIVISRCLTEDGHTRLNDGVSMFRSSPYAQIDLECVFMRESTPEIQCGQDVLEEMSRDSKFRFVIERHKAINSFLYEEYGMPSTTIGNWTPGDFVLHTPGRTNDRRVEIFNKIVPQILR